MSMARHTYGDWIRHSASGKVAVITTDQKLGFCNWLVNVKYADGRIEALTLFDYDLIMEYEYFEQVDPSRCGEPMRLVADSYSVSLNMQDDWFCGGKMKSYFPVKIKGEDLFA